MELKDVVLTIIKILISVPAIHILFHPCYLSYHSVDGAALMGGHLDNTPPHAVTYNVTESISTDSQENLVSSSTDNGMPKDLVEDDYEEDDHHQESSEEIPNPSPLVNSGYNLPENIFNKGKPFYLEKDPLTGQIDFDTKTPTLRLDDDLYDYVEEEPSSNIYDKSNIDRKDGSLNSHHKPSDVNQLTPNFHDFLNLPVKYNPQKYVYPLISSSYANTKIQGNVNKYHNHKDYAVKSSTQKPSASPTYYGINYDKKPEPTATTTVRTTSSTTPRSTTQKTISTEIYLTTKAPETLMNSGMGHPSFHEDFDYYDSMDSKKQQSPDQIYLTTQDAIDNIHLTTKSPSGGTSSSTTTTKRPMSLFEQLFGDYDEIVTTTTEKSKPPSLFGNLPNNKNKNKYDSEIKTEKPSFIVPSSTTTEHVHYPNLHAGPNVLTGSNMGLENASYEYEDEYGTAVDDNVAVDTKKVTVTSSTTQVPSTTVGSTTTTLSSTTKNNKNSTNLQPHETSEDFYSEYDDLDRDSNKSSTTSESTTSSVKVTSLPLGENHISSLNSRQPIIVATQNLREQLNHEKVVPPPPPKPSFVFEKTQPPSTSNVRIAADQDTVSFVVGHHQNVDGGHFVSTSLKESPYDSNPFRPLYGQPAQYPGPDTVSYTIQSSSPPQQQQPQQEIYRPPPPALPPTVVVQGHAAAAGGAAAVTIQPLRNSEASLAIGVPVQQSMQQIPGQVVDEKLELNLENVEYPKGTGPKVVFPDDIQESSGNGVTNLVPPPVRQQLLPSAIGGESLEPLQPPPLNREVLKLNSKPVYHQLPSDLTPPKETEILGGPMPPPPARIDTNNNRPRPPWDPRPGHFFSGGKPEYAVRVPRPHPPEIAYKRIDTLPNILPQFRPNMKLNIPQPPQIYLNRQPLLDRPSNRPIGFFEKLHPPPPPHFLHSLRKLPPQPPQSLEQPSRQQSQAVAEDRIMNEGPNSKNALALDQFNFYQMPPKVVLPNRRNGNAEGDVETLQMIQAKKSEKKEPIATSAAENSKTEVPSSGNQDNLSSTEKPLYVVYPVNTPPIKMDVVADSNKKESVVIGTRAELPLPPSKISQDFSYDQNPIFSTKDRNDSPVLKPHPRPTYPIKSDFPYPLERPDPSVLNPAVPETPANHLDEPDFVGGNQWNTIESRIENGNMKQPASQNSKNQISVTLRTYTERPIAVAYTPTEPQHLSHYGDHNSPGSSDGNKYSMPNYASPVIPEIRPGANDSSGHGKPDNEFTVSAVMHTRVQFGNHQNQNNQNSNVKSHKTPTSNRYPEERLGTLSNHRISEDEDGQDDVQKPSVPKLGFEAPFQASVSIDNAAAATNHGWSVVKNSNKSSTTAGSVLVDEATTLPLATTSEFDIENFKPQLEGGFKPIYSFPEESPSSKNKDSEVSERQEK